MRAAAVGEVLGQGGRGCRFKRAVLFALCVLACSCSDPVEPDQTPQDIGPDGVVGISLQVIDDRARSCEVLLSDPGEALVDVRFTTLVEGRRLIQGGRTSLAFFRAGEDRIPGDAVTLLLRDKDAVLDLRRAHCFDADGAELGDSVALVR